jgi:hypothetical protein
MFGEGLVPFEILTDHDHPVGRGDQLAAAERVICAGIDADHRLEHGVDLGILGEDLLDPGVAFPKYLGVQEIPVDRALERDEVRFVLLAVHRVRHLLSFTGQELHGELRIR